MTPLQSVSILNLYSFLKSNLSQNHELISCFSSWKVLWSGLNGNINIGKFSPEELLKSYGIDSTHEDDIYILIFCLESYYAYNLYINRPIKFSDNFLGIFSWILSNENLIEFDSTTSKKNISLDSLDQYFRSLYEEVFPQSLRHRTGSFFTPASVAEYILDDFFENTKNILDKKVLEPNSGSGTFLIAITNYLIKKEFRKDEIFDFLKNNIVCLDKNPISVLTTKVVKEWLLYLVNNGLYEIFDLNIYFSDCINELNYRIAINESQKLEEDFLLSIAENVFKINTHDALKIIKNDIIFKSIENSEKIDKSIIKDYNQFSLIYDFMKKSYDESKNLYFLYKEYIKNTYSLERKNYFDIVLGNPPWINWENLDKNYRSRIEFIWPFIGLFAYSGSKMAFSKEDISTFITYVVSDYYLKNKGILGFFLSQTIFQSFSNSRGFRNFYLLNNNTPLKILSVKDFGRSKIFDGANTKTAFLTLVKGENNSYPINYFKFDLKFKYKDYLSFYVSNQALLLAEPSDTKDITSNWRIYDQNSGSVSGILGNSAYRARAGIFTGGANAVYYQELFSYSDNIFKTSNVTERAKRFFPKMQLELESDLIYPFVRGRDVEEWIVQYSSSRAILIPHTIESKMVPIEEKILQQKYPYTYEYLYSAKEFLHNRGGLTAMDKVNADKGFYTILRVGDYTFSKYKVVWRYIHTRFTCAVLEPTLLINNVTKPCIPQEKLMTIACNSEIEAFYLCGYLGSKQVKNFIESKMVNTQISAHVIQNIHIPLFDINNLSHQKIAELCKEGHKLKSLNPKNSIEEIRNCISDLVEEIIKSR